MPTLSASFPVAKKFHRCTGCNRPIQKGERYSRWTGTSDAWIGLVTAKDCADCARRYGRPIPASTPTETSGDE